MIFLANNDCPYVEQGAPPSAYPISRVIEGDMSGWGGVFTGGLIRSLFIAPGLALSGIRGKQLITASLLSSATITSGLFVLYALRKKGIVRF